MKRNIVATINYRVIFLLISAFLLASLISCKPAQKPKETATMEKAEKKIVIYQVFTRLFGNKNSTNKPWGTIEENGVGKFADFTDTALKEIRDLGITHIWYTGVLHHAVIRDYAAIGITSDDPDVVKGRAGSPYAIKDYYNVNPDLATDPAKRLEEFKSLVSRTHALGMKVIIDIVPNHVARKYISVSKPEGITDLGAEDDVNTEYRKDNNFYYIPGEHFKVPVSHDNYKPLGGEVHPLSDGKFDEFPAKWTGNGSRRVQPDINDWYETIKVNYGLRPDGGKDFDTLPGNFREADIQTHREFWQNKSVPSSWIKMRDIALYWLKFGVDGFRFDMAEMVPVEFWSYLNSWIKTDYPQTVCVAEVYNPSLYRDYIHFGKLDYLYDKVELYDTLKWIIQGKTNPDVLPWLQENKKDISHHMLHFLENHDEQRIASPEFAGSARKALPAMVVSTLISSSPTLLYFGQELGEPGAEHAGFGHPSRTSIFDYIGVPHHQRWMNDGRFDGGRLSAGEKELRKYYQRLLNLSISSPAFVGQYQELHNFNRDQQKGYGSPLFSFARWNEGQKFIVITNFSTDHTVRCTFTIPQDLVKAWNLNQGDLKITDRLNEGSREFILHISDYGASIDLNVGPLESLVLEIK